MDSRRDFTSKKVFSGYFSELGEKANPALAKGREPKGQSRKPHQYFLRGSMSALSFPKLPGDVKD